MYKLISDTFNINEFISSNSTEVLLENEFTIPDNAPNIEKIVSTEGKARINGVTVSDGSVTVEGEVVYNIIYRSNDEEILVYSITDTIPFTEEIAFPDAREGMTAHVDAILDYMDSDSPAEKTYSIKAVIVLDTELANNHPVTFVSNLESDGSFQAKTRNIKYTDEVNSLSEEVNINDAVELNKGSDEIAKVLKADSEVYITSIDVLDEKMLVEGICKVAFLYSENNNLNSTGYVSEEFPFTHYIEAKNLSEDMLRDVNISLNDMTYKVAENYDNELKLIEFDLSFMINANLFDTVEKNIITDCYSTEYVLDLESEKVNLTSISDIMNKTVKYDNSFDVVTGTIKDIYTVDISPKVSEKKVVDNKYIIDGFMDMNILYLNGDINKIDKAYASLPFTASFDLKDNEAKSEIDSDITITKSGAYRKGSNSVIVNCDINVCMKLKDKDEITVISNITETTPIDRSKMPSLVFRVVQPNESIWDIAKNYNLSINYLKEINNLPEDNEVAAGSKIIIARMV
ncbi:SPOCS domain-containing protein [Sedimentibacter sp.]|uniref:DUF3794 and LysM peptidoglycan-binding domain-containing protein n=1 Tax=Sedimentibacter sp. TaxID=1960295 RepID=UPI0028A27FD5|nr:SPOCS domain-containing protein [Sedimentibacter sp.]